MSCAVVVCVACPRGNATTSSSLLLLNPRAKNRHQGTSAKLCCRSSSSSSPSSSRSLSTGLLTSMSSSSSIQEEVKEKVVKQADLVRRWRREGAYYDGITNWNLNEAYDRCLELAAIDASSFLLTTSPDSPLNSGLSFIVKTISSILWKPERNKAFAALAVWCRRTDQLVDGINGCCATPEVLDKWEQRLINLFQGRPSDIYDAALFDTILKYPIDIQLFKDLIEGMRMDLRKTRYENFDELYLYSYHVAGTVALMAVQLMGTAPESKASLERVYEAALAFGLATQLTDILRDIGEDARMGRIYLPQDELACAGLSNDDIHSGKVTDKWRNFMKGQIKRVRMYSDEGEKLIGELNSDDKWLVWLVTLLNRQILDKIEADDYSLTKQASVGIGKQAMTVLAAHGISLGDSSSNFVELVKLLCIIFPLD